MKRLPRLAALAAIAIALAFMGGKSAGEDAADELRKRFFGIEAWYGQVVVSIHGEGSKGDEWGRTCYSVRREAEVKFRVKYQNSGMSDEAQAKAMELLLANAPPKEVPSIKKAMEEMRRQRMWSTKTTKREPEDLDDVRLLVNDRVESWGKEACGEPYPYHDLTTASGADTRTDECVDSLHFDLAMATWELRLDAKVDILTGTRTAMHSGGPPDEDGHSNDSNKQTVRPGPATGLPGLMAKMRPLPDPNGTLSGSEEIPKDELPMQVDFGTLEGTISWVISPVPFEEVELVLKPGEAYSGWRPLPGPDEKTAGNSIRMQVVLQKPGGGNPSKVRMTSLVVRLSDVSREPGICINWPAKGGTRTPDLQFETSRNSGEGVTVDGEGTRLRKKGGEFVEQGVEVSAFDGGAWGELVAEASLTDGRHLFAKLDGHPETGEVRLPKRSPDSKIADVWMSKRKQTGKKDDADDDAKPAGDKQTGDGLSIYEEYRGYREKQAWKEADPENKDFFVRNEAGGVADGGVTLFASITELAVHRLEPDELSADRVVNVNHERGARVVEQHGVVIRNEPTFKGFCMAVGKRTTPGTPKDFDYVGLGNVPTHAVNLVTKGVVRKSRFNVPTVAHEILHCCNVYHHGEESDSTIKGVLWTKRADGIYDRGTKIRILNSKGKDLTPQALKGTWPQAGILVEWFRWQGAASGDTGCVMRYDMARVYTPQDEPDVRVVVTAAEEAIGGGLCTSNEATGTNLKPGRFGPCFTGRGNCKGQILVNDAKPAPGR